MPLPAIATTLIGNIVASIIGSIADAPDDPALLDPAYQEGAMASASRMFPVGTALGILAGPPENGMVLINGQALRTAPGLQIRNERNMIMFPTMLNRQYMKVRYQLDPMGNAWRIWILTQTEIAQAGSFPKTPRMNIPFFPELVQ